MAKKIVVPAVITLRDMATGTPGQKISFREWAFLTWFRDPRWHRDLARLAIVAQEFNTKKTAGEEIVLEDADFSTLAEVVKDYQGPQQEPLLAMQLESFKVLVLSVK